MISTEFPHDSSLHTQPYTLEYAFVRNKNLYDTHFLRLNYIYSEQISVLILEPVACQQ